MSVNSRVLRGGLGQFEIEYISSTESESESQMFYLTKRKYIFVHTISYCYGWSGRPSLRSENDR